MYNVGLSLLVIGALIVFGSDKLFKKGKIQTMKDLLIVKGIGLAITVVGMIIMIKIY
ncbi:MAG: hypothetical protein SCJ93_03325 [Bacillota bacterium]|nr:hypothetical protein [Bacillota bacterium]